MKEKMAIRVWGDYYFEGGDKSSDGYHSRKYVNDNSYTVLDC